MTQLYKTNRQSLRLPHYNYSSNGAYFITICLKNRECLLGDICNNKFVANQLGDIVLDTWYFLSNRYEEINLDEFVVMPNHIHGIVIINRKKKI